ncbi:MAG: hypothetical protein J6C53_01585 [Clostridia bacterium]|nr:hypothetical protein [Clostridia bacterium]
MDKKTPINIAIVSLNDKFSNTIASSLASKLGMFVADCHQMIVYELINPKDVLQKCGIDYFKKREKSAVKNCAGFLDTVISVNYDIIHEYHSLFENSLIIYVKLPEERITQAVNKVSYTHRDEFLREIANGMVIELEKRSSVQAVKKIMDKLGEYYENC